MKFLKILIVALTVFAVVFSSVSYAFATSNDVDGGGDINGGNLPPDLVELIVFFATCGIEIVVGDAAWDALMDMYYDSDVQQVLNWSASDLYERYTAASMDMSQRQHDAIFNVLNKIKEVFGFDDDTIVAVDSGTYNSQGTTNLQEVSTLNYDATLLLPSLITQMQYAYTANYRLSSMLLHTVPDDFVGPPAPVDYTLSDFGNSSYWVIISSSSYYNQGVTCSMYNNGHVVSFPSYLGMDSIYETTIHKVYNPVKVKFSNNKYGLYMPYYLHRSDGLVHQGLAAPTLIDGRNYIYKEGDRVYAVVSGTRYYLDDMYTEASQYAYDLMFSDSVPRDSKIIVKNDDGTYSNITQNITYNPAIDYSLINDAIKNGIESANIHVDIPSELQTTYQEYYDQHVVNNVENVVYTYDDTEILKALDEMKDSIVVSTDENTDNGFLSSLNDIVSDIRYGVSNISSYLSSVYQKIVNIYNKILELPATISDSISAGFDKINYFFNPNHPDFQDPFGDWFYALLLEKFDGVQEFVDNFQDITDTDSELLIEHDISVGSYIYHMKVDFSWYEDYRLVVRGGIQVIFYLLFVLSQLKMLFGMFDIHFGGGGGSSFSTGGNEQFSSGDFSDSKGYVNWLHGGGK